MEPLAEIWEESNEAQRWAMIALAGVAVLGAVGVGVYAIRQGGIAIASGDTLVGMGKVAGSTARIGRHDDLTELPG